MIYKCTVRGPEEMEPLVEAILWSCDAQSVSSPPMGELPRFLEAFFLTPNRFQVEQALILGCESDYSKLSMEWEEVGETDWVEHVRAGFVPISAGPFQIVAEWQESPADNMTLKIRPGQAFGTGHHETTQMALECLAHLPVLGKRVLDVGCGTGILAIAAEKLGAKSILGFDNDPDCRENMADHLTLNKTQNVRLQIGTLDELHETPWDIVLANITLNVLVMVWPAIFDHLEPGGILITTGLLIEQEAEALQKLKSLGFEIKRTLHRGEWMLIEAQKPC